MNIKMTYSTLKHFGLANRLLVRLMTHRQCVQYAIYAAEQVIDIYEKEYPKDKRPREAINAAIMYLENPNEDNRTAANAAANAIAYGDNAVINAVANAANNVARTVRDPMYAANAAQSATHAVKSAKDMKTKILKYGIKLLKNSSDAEGA